MNKVGVEGVVWHNGFWEREEGRKEGKEGGRERGLWMGRCVGINVTQ